MKFQQQAYTLEVPGDLRGIMRAWPALLLFAFVAAGCLDADGSQDVPGQAPTGSQEGAADSGTRDPPQRSPSRPPSGPDDQPPPASRDPPPAETWFLHNQITCQEEPCNCGSQRQFMDRGDHQGDCDGYGRRLGDVPIFPSDCADACFPAAEPMARFAAGASVHGTLFFTSDVADEISVDVALWQGQARLGGVTTGPVTVIGLGGLNYAPMPFDFTLDEPVTAGAQVELRLHVDATESWFLGYEDEHASRFTIFEE